MKLIVIRRAADYMVELEGDPRVWDCGNTVAEAIGNWVVAHGNDNGVEVELPATTKYDRYRGTKTQYTGNAVDIPSR